MIDGRSERLARLRDELEDDKADSLSAQFYRRRRAFGWTAAAMVAVLLVVAVMVPIFGGYFHRHTVTTHVVSKENVCKSNGNNGVTCEYLIFTDAGTFKITDALFGLVRFNSSDIYGRVREDKDYTIVYYGWRIPLFSTYPNIESITPVEG